VIIIEVTDGILKEPELLRVIPVELSEIEVILGKLTLPPSAVIPLSPETAEAFIVALPPV
jgi:hypothetical protein